MSRRSRNRLHNAVRDGVRKLPFFLPSFLLFLHQAADPPGVRRNVHARTAAAAFMRSASTNPRASCRPLGVAAETASPSFLAEHPNHKFLYAVNEAAAAGSVSAFAIDDKTGKLTPLNEVSSGGNGRATSRSTRRASGWLVANYGDGAMASFRCRPTENSAKPASVEKHTGIERQPAAAARSRMRTKLFFRRTTNFCCSPISASTKSSSTSSTRRPGS